MSTNKDVQTSPGQEGGRSSNWTSYIRQGAQKSFNSASERANLEIESMKEEFGNLLTAYDNLLIEHKNLLEKHNTIISEHKDEREKWKIFKEWWQGKMDLKKTPSNSLTKNRMNEGQIRISIETPKRDENDAIPKHSNRTLSRITDSESKILQDVGLTPSGISGNHIDEMPYLPTPSHTFMRKTASSSPTAECLQRSDKVIQRSRLSHEFNLESSSHGQQERAISHDPSIVNNEKKRKPLRDVLNNVKSSSSDVVNDDGQTNNQPEKQNKTINQEFEINPEMNGNLPYLHKDVIRTKSKRKQMHANDCECCKDYYDAVGPVAIRPFEDVKKGRISLSKNNDNIEGNGEKRKGIGNDNIEKDKRQEHLQRTSRHRDYGPPPSTPPVYWNIAFPTTQEVSEVNRSVDAAERKRREDFARDPRFRKRLE